MDAALQTPDGRARKEVGHPFHDLVRPDSKALSRTLASWFSMLVRCYDSESLFGNYYMLRGICVCERWYLFSNFVADMGLRPQGTTIDRINNDGHYEPGNCRWATPKQQARNSRQVKRVNVAGQALPLVDVAAMAGVSGATITRRRQRGMTGDEMVNTKAIKKIKLCPRQVEQIKVLATAASKDQKVASRFGVSRQTISQIRRGVTWA